MTTTPNFGWTLPVVNADADTWGAELNANLTSQDTQLKTISDTASAASTAAGAALAKSANLSDLSSPSAARANLGVSPTGADSTYNVRNNNLSDVANPSVVRANLSLSATGADITYCYRANNLIDIASPATARANLGVKSMATRDVTIQSGGTASGGVDGDIVFIY